jgi:hypothetical protein
MKSLHLTLVCVVFVLSPAQSFAQKKSRKPAKPAPPAAAKEPLEPLRVASGLMTGDRIAVRRSDWIRDGQPLFDYTLTGARLSGDRLEFTGTLVEAGNSKAHAVTATLLTTSARSANPWPSTASATARDRQPRQRPAEGERNEQTQSLYSAMAEVGLGCELVFLKLATPLQSEALQVGVVLAHQDNERGNQINRALCHIVRAMKTGAGAGEALARLNQILSTK